MNVEELIALLQTFKPSSTVVIGNFGGGFDELEDVSAIPVALNVIVSSESGAHMKLESLTDEEQENYNVVNAVCIGDTDPSLVEGRQVRFMRIANQPRLSKHKRKRDLTLSPNPVEDQ